MNKVSELKIDSTLWATPAKIVNLLDFKPEKLSIETKSNSNNDIKGCSSNLSDGCGVRWMGFRPACL